ncbi:MAG TPA: molybdopterin molybdenumtransferase MoeA [Methanomicrobia archaeon]|nr:molybdopterin molybdenumtransferase MoeA [Methanomicrobia archaeon]
MGKQFLEITEQQEVEALIARVATTLVENWTRSGRAVERVSITEALGRIAAAEVVSALDVPPFDRATMDGYAVVASDTFYADEVHPVSLQLLDTLFAGMQPTRIVTEGSCMGISTGASLPAGANAVVKIENAAECQEHREGRSVTAVQIFKPVAPAENVMHAGSDIKRGERILATNTVLTPRATGVLAACGLTEVLVHQKPRVAILSTGNELVAPGEALPPAKIYDVNAQTLCDSVRALGCIPCALGIARDTPEALSQLLERAIETEADVILVSGGTSAGVGDLLPQAIEARGEMLVHGVDIKPGKPFIFGMIQERPIFGLPGNPTSALITFNQFVAPLLRRLAGAAPEFAGRSGRTITAQVTQRIFSEPGRNEYVLVKLSAPGSPEEYHRATPVLSGSGAITTLAKADGYFLMAKGKELLEENELVDVVLFSELPAGTPW